MLNGFFVFILLISVLPIVSLAATLPDPNFTTFNTQQGLSSANVYNMV